jgi:hypothetical protein
VSSDDIFCLFMRWAHVCKSIVRCHEWTEPEKYVALR